MPAYQNVVVGVHDSPTAARVVELAGLEAAETGAKLILVTAYHSSGSGPAELTLKRAAETCAEMGAGTVETLAVVGDPATVLTDVARDRGADLLVVGNHGLSTLGERLVRSVPGEVIDKASCDVLITHTTTDRWHKLVSRRHRHEPSTHPRKFVVGVHDTAHSMRAVEKAGELAADLDAELVLVGAYEHAEEWHPPGGRKLEVSHDLGSAMDALGAADSHLAQADLWNVDSALVNGAARARAKGARKVTTFAVPDNAVHGLLEIADQRGADIVVVGNHPQARGPARLIGSISSQVSHKAPIHVLLVR
jgi:nucleotide-binding universal stress UspA family protein